MRKRNRLALVLTMPIAIIFLLIGWILIKIGTKQKPVKTKTPGKKEVTLAIIAEEQEISLKHATPKS